MSIFLTFLLKFISHRCQNNVHYYSNTITLVIKGKRANVTRCHCIWNCWKLLKYMFLLKIHVLLCKYRLQNCSQNDLVGFLGLEHLVNATKLILVHQSRYCCHSADRLEERCNMRKRKFSDTYVIWSVKRKKLQSVNCNRLM